MATPDHTPLAVDLDGTLVRTDTLLEGLFGLLRTRPARLFALLPALVRGRAALKDRLAAEAVLDAADLPLNRGLLDWLREARAAGRRLPGLPARTDGWPSR